MWKLWVFLAAHSCCTVPQALAANAHLSLCSCSPISAAIPSGEVVAPASPVCSLSSMDEVNFGFNLKGIIYRHDGLKIHFWAQELFPGPVRLSGKLGLGQDINLPDFVSGSSDLSRLILGKNDMN